MSYVTGTAHYNLPQTVGTDKRDWSDTNKAFADVDAALYGATNDLSDVTSRVTTLEGDNVDNKANIAKNASDIVTLETRTTAAEHVANDANNGLNDVRRDSQDMITAYNEPSAESKHDYEPGDFFIYNDVLYRATASITANSTIIPNTNCEATNVTTTFRRHIVPLTGSYSEMSEQIGTLVSGHLADFYNLILVMHNTNNNKYTIYTPMSVSATGKTSNYITGGTGGVDPGQGTWSIDILSLSTGKCYVTTATYTTMWSVSVAERTTVGSNLKFYAVY